MSSTGREYRATRNGRRVFWQQRPCHSDETGGRPVARPPNRTRFLSPQADRNVYHPQRRVRADPAAVRVPRRRRHRPIPHAVPRQAVGAGGRRAVPGDRPVHEGVGEAGAVGPTPADGGPARPHVRVAVQPGTGGARIDGGPARGGGTRERAARPPPGSAVAGRPAARLGAAADPIAPHPPAAGGRGNCGLRSPLGRRPRRWVGEVGVRSPDRAADHADDAGVPPLGGGRSTCPSPRTTAGRSPARRGTRRWRCWSPRSAAARSATRKRAVGSTPAAGSSGRRCG